MPGTTPDGLYMIYVCVCVCVCACARMCSADQLCLALCDTVDWSPPGSSVPGILQESGLPFPTPGDLADPRIEPASPALAGRFFTTVPLGKPLPMISYLLLTILSRRSMWPHFTSEETEAPGLTCPKLLS